MIQVKNTTTGEQRVATSMEPYASDPDWVKVADLAADLTADELSMCRDGAPEPEAFRAHRWRAIRAARDAAQDGGCATPLGRVDSDAASRGKISGAVQLALIAQAAGAPFSIDWTMADNAAVTHDAAAMIALGVAVGQHVDACHVEGRVRRAALDAAQDAAAIAAVPAEGGWPGV